MHAFSCKLQECIIFLYLIWRQRVKSCFDKLSKDQQRPLVTMAKHTFSVYCFIHVAVEYHFRVIQIKTKKGNHGVQSGVDYYMTKSRRKFKKKKPDPRQTQRKPRVSFCGLLWYWVVSGRYVLYVHGNKIYRYDHRNTKRLLLNHQDV